MVPYTGRAMKDTSSQPRTLSELSQAKEGEWALTQTHSSASGISNAKMPPKGLRWWVPLGKEQGQDAIKHSVGIFGGDSRSLLNLWSSQLFTCEFAYLCVS